MIRQRRRRGRLAAAGIIGIMLAAMVGVAHGSVYYSTSFGGDNGDGTSIWHYTFSVTPTRSFTDLWIYFPYDYFLDLSNPVAGPGWDAAGTTAPIAAHLFNGFYLAVNAQEQRAGVKVEGFSVDTVAPLPLALAYELYNGSDPVETGLTAVPEPATWQLLGFFGPLLFCLRRGRSAASRSIH